MQASRETILTALDVFVRQRPRLEFGNYGDRKAYAAEARSIARDKRDAEFLLRQVALSSITVDTLAGAFRAFSGRLKLTETEGGQVALDYCTGQYWPTEYRKAVCSVLSAALWDHMRDDYAAFPRVGQSKGDAIRERFAKHFGLRIARRWFDYDLPRR